LFAFRVLAKGAAEAQTQMPVVRKEGWYDCVQVSALLSSRLPALSKQASKAHHLNHSTDIAHSHRWASK
jgi:hypothetical protein